MTEAESLYLKIGLSIAGSEKSQLFGKPCFKINKKAFICFFQESMVFKLTNDVHKEAINLEHAFLFDPSGKGRPMKQWVQVSYKDKDSWSMLANEAANYVSNS